jgi:hypothetical protein
MNTHLTKAQKNLLNFLKNDKFFISYDRVTAKIKLREKLNNDCILPTKTSTLKPIQFKTYLIIREYLKKISSPFTSIEYFSLDDKFFNVEL